MGFKELNKIAMDDHDFSTINLINLLENIKCEIRDGKVTEEIQESIWDALMWDKKDPENNEMIKYLFTGWWIHQMSQEKSIP